ncbi:unnamed protein product [Vitrella brassicaformis CCMP3155]|uniref:Uncharacterized protein n=1 Tax=Vitrella brassicaformis (strain CCMP3155) TaxID=1169540 RepID=A0A0G4H4B8_VITBC|nr:unnamed protein product [Vitrella brassicaformis CCMP3155]|eukprot:CEM38604.1 unnamed protein product [Vitrella brassicaformis CCMP3155]
MRSGPAAMMHPMALWDSCGLAPATTAPTSTSPSSSRASSPMCWTTPRTVDCQPDIKLPGRYGTIKELFGLDHQETAELRGEDRPSRDDDNATKRQEEEEGEEERVQRARDKVANSHIDKETYAPFISGILDDGPLLPGQWSEEVLSMAWLLSDPARGLGLLPALFGVAGSDGKVPQGWDFTNAQLDHVLDKFEKENPCPRRGNEGESSFVERRLRNAARYCTDRNTLGHLRLSDTFRRLQLPGSLTFGLLSLFAAAKVDRDGSQGAEEEENAPTEGQPVVTPPSADAAGRGRGRGA